MNADEATPPRLVTSPWLLAFLAFLAAMPTALIPARIVAGDLAGVVALTVLCLGFLIWAVRTFRTIRRYRNYYIETSNLRYWVGRSRPGRVLVNRDAGVAFRVERGSWWWRQLVRFPLTDIDAYSRAREDDSTVTVTADVFRFAVGFVGVVHLRDGIAYDFRRYETGIAPEPRHPIWRRPRTLLRELKGILRANRAGLLMADFATVRELYDQLVTAVVMPHVEGSGRNDH